MKQLSLFTFLLFIFSSCQEVKDENKYLIGTGEVQDYQQQTCRELWKLNRRLISQIEGYDSLLPKTGSTSKWVVNSDKLIKNYRQLQNDVSKFHTNQFQNKFQKDNVIKIGNQIIAELESIDTSLFQSIRMEIALWTDLTDKIKSIRKRMISTIQELPKKSLENQTSSDILKLNQLELDMFILHTFVFQLIVEHKEKYELNYGYFLVHLGEDKELPNGKRQIEIFSLADNSDINEIEILVNDKKIESKKGRALYTFDPNEIKEDSIKVSVKGINIIKSEVSFNSKKFKIK